MPAGYPSRRRVNDRLGLIYERLDGHSMWEIMTHLWYYRATFVLNVQILSGNRSAGLCLAMPTAGRRYIWLRLEAALCKRSIEP